MRGLDWGGALLALGGLGSLVYGLIAALLSVAIISGVGAFGDSLSGVFNHVSDTINGPATSTN